MSGGGAALPGGVKLALDWGERRIGVAACDPAETLAYPVATVDGADPWPALAALAAEHRPAAVVVGWPRRLDGTAGLAADRAAARAAEAATRLGVGVWLVDERLTTAEASRKLAHAGRSAKAQRRVVDQQAAVGILESVLAARRAGRPIGAAVAPAVANEEATR
ncbi:MAG: Holliday junction resolvase RuvX [Propionibacteriaceae bacterium]|nr:Holliday junction resolvase RuvX [Propionibacteriaceae bacterium]